ncbi:MAG TPA: hypothetical protein VEU06_04630 [Micropepsaceae bacterium]|nr:hypothetical protein [Micropepsaceae bacterium]
MSNLAETRLFRPDTRGAGASVWLWRTAPALCAAAYPFLSQLLSGLLVAGHGSASPDGLALWLGVAGSLLLALGVMGAAFASLRAQTGFRSRATAHLAFATPSLFVGFGNVANLLHSPELAIIAWPIFWTLVAAFVFVQPKAQKNPALRIGPTDYRRLAIAHGISASLILILFVAPHLTNHAAGLLSGAAHIEFMKEARQFYRAVIFEPLLLALIGFQIASGTLLVRRRLRGESDFFGRLQTMSGVYVGIYFIAHLTAVFGARYAGTDTNWNWLTNNDHSMLAGLSNLRLIAHYWFGPIAIATHLGCGLRLVLREHGIAARFADLAPRLAIGAGAIVSSVILVALLGVHVS